MLSLNDFLRAWNQVKTKEYMKYMKFGWTIIIVLVVFLGFVSVTRFLSNWGGREKMVSGSSDLLQNITAEELMDYIRNSDAKVKLVNVWATWCGFCVEEFPVILDLRKKYRERGFELIFVSADMPEDRKEVEEFLARQGVDFKTYLKSEADQKFIDTLHSDWSGALPASFIYDAQGQLVNFWTGDASFEEFEEQILYVLNHQKET